MKRIVIIAPGSQGDVQPYVALGKALEYAGNYVRLVTHKNFESLVTSHGLEFYPVESDVQEIVENQVMRERIEKGNFLSLMRQMAKEAQIGSLSLAEAGVKACQGMELVLAGMGGLFTGFALAEKFQLPFIQAYLLPFTPTQYCPSVLTPNIPRRWGKLLNRLSHHLTSQIIWQGFRSADSLARRKVLDLPVESFFGPYNSHLLNGLPVLYGFSPSVIPVPPDWVDPIQVTGYWFLDSADDWVPPSELLDFLNRGSPPVYIGFGSMSNRRPEEIADLVIKAIGLCNTRAIISSGWGGLQKAYLPETVFMINSITHAWLFPRCAAAVHHGGAGTTAASLRAGVPTISVPFFGDQPFWGQRIAELGVGPKPIPRKKLTVDRLTVAIKEALTGQDMRQRAARLGAQIQAEDGLAKAVEIIQAVGGS